MKGGVRFWHIRAICNFGSVVSPDSRLTLTDPRLHWRYQANALIDYSDGFIPSANCRKPAIRPSDLLSVVTDPEGDFARTEGLVGDLAQT
jgi:hypothetical protein